MDKEERIKIYRQTMDILKKNEYVAPSGKHISFEGLNKPLLETKFYSTKVKNDYDSLQKYNTIIEVVDMDCLYNAKLLIDEGLHPAVLNMASFSTPGGGVEKGSAAQEESIFRRSNIALSLYQFHSIGENYGLRQREERYPLDYNYGGIYTPGVTVFRKSEKDNCELLEAPFIVDVVSVSAVKKPALIDGKIAPWVCDVIMNKIRQILDIAIANGNDSVVLGAFGCGAYGTPPKEMAELFKKVLSNDRYKSAFKLVSFAIIDDKNSYKEHNPEGNLKPFKDVFET
jgi:uncharacterized protein (TIGR02452 family)